MDTMSNSIFRRLSDEEVNQFKHTNRNKCGMVVALLFGTIFTLFIVSKIIFQ